VTVPSAAKRVLQMSAIARVGNLRRLDVAQINEVLDAYPDTQYGYTASLGRDRICRLANRLQSIEDLPPEVRAEIDVIVPRLRRAFDLMDNQDTTYGLVVRLVEELDQHYRESGIGESLDNRFTSVCGVAVIKVEAAQMIAELLVIGMDIEGQGFRSDLNLTTRKMAQIMSIWM
jgi:hypothetical protein